MVYYSINDLEKITGVKAHTIRIWEKRYNAVLPERTSTNIRYYKDEDLKRLLNISLLNRYGYRISSIIKMSPSEINEQIMRITDSTSDNDTQIENLMLSMIEMSEEKFEKVLSNAVLRMGFVDTVTGVIYPFLERIGLLWQVGAINPAQEHFISNLIRQKLIVAIDGLSTSYKKNTRTFILFLPTHEFHELSLLFFHYLIKQMGHKVVYLGQLVPMEEVGKVENIHLPDFLLTVITSSLSAEEYKEFIHELSGRFNDKTIFVSGYQVREHHMVLPENVVAISGPDQFRTDLTKYL